jgi:hypothetical protein
MAILTLAGLMRKGRDLLLSPAIMVVDTLEARAEGAGAKATAEPMKQARVMAAILVVRSTE